MKKLILAILIASTLTVNFCSVSATDSITETTNNTNVQIAPASQKNIVNPEGVFMMPQPETNDDAMHNSQKLADKIGIDKERLRKSIEQSLYVELPDVKDINKKFLDIYGVEIVPDTVHFFYYADLDTIVKSNKITFRNATSSIDGKEYPEYRALLQTADGVFCGDTELILTDKNGPYLLSYSTMKNNVYILDFKAKSDYIINSLLKAGFSSQEVSSSKLAWIEGIGYSYVTTADGKDWITAIGLQQIDSPLVEQNLLPLEVLTEDKIFSMPFDEWMTVIRKTYVEPGKRILPYIAPGENPPTGGVTKDAITYITPESNKSHNTGNSRKIMIR